MDPKISEFYAGKSVLITGGTGFLGKALLEKLLRECPEISSIFLLVRPTKTQTPQERVQMILQEEFFDLIRGERPNFDLKVITIPSDLAKPAMGISQGYLLEKMRREVSIILHCAATVNFNEKLDVSLATNVSSVKHLLDFARSLSKLDAFVHVSTAFAHCDRSHIEEKIYPPTVDPLALVSAVNTMSPELVSQMTKALLGKRPNTFTFTKSLAEAVVSQEGRGLPLAVVRPSIMGCSLRSPFPGWTDNLNGPGGLYIATAHKVLKVVPGKPNSFFDIVPVDHCANMIIAASWKVAVSPPPQGPLVLNCTSGSQNPITFQKHNELVLKAINKSPLAPTSPSSPPVSVHIVSLWAYERFWSPLLHLAPAYVVDLYRQAIGKKPMMNKIYRKLQGSLRAYSYFTSHQWTWDVENSKNLMLEMCEEDRVTFSLDLSDLHWETYLGHLYEGCKKFIRAPKPTKSAEKGPSASSQLSISPSSSLEDLTSPSGSTLHLGPTPSTINLINSSSAVRLLPSRTPAKRDLPVFLTSTFVVLFLAIILTLAFDYIFETHLNPLSPHTHNQTLSNSVSSSILGDLLLPPSSPSSNLGN